MSLISFEDLFVPSRRQPVHYHHRHTPELMTLLLNHSFDHRHQLERQLGKDIQEVGNNYNFKCSVAGYRPEELSVNVQGEELRTFERRLTLPASLDKQSIKCHLDEHGHLQMQAVKKG
uniref:SHSP domain-containing protein n=1 Tax=Ditylenchus dipsaci TaxID=166011 RepID=A0A915DQS7_9BILA